MKECLNKHDRLDDENLESFKKEVEEKITKLEESLKVFRCDEIEFSHDWFNTIDLYIRFEDNPPLFQVIEIVYEVCGSFSEIEYDDYQNCLFVGFEKVITNE